MLKLLSGLVVNTLGVGTDLSLLAFVADIIPKQYTGRTFLHIATFESLGSLVGVGILYPSYQWGLLKGSWDGGTPYYVCAVSRLNDIHKFVILISLQAIYIVVAVLIWHIRPVIITSSRLTAFDV